MENLYGFKREDALKLIEFVKERKGESLTAVFKKYAMFSGKARGTVRNLYYTLSKMSVKDKEFCDKYLGGVPLLVEEKVEFFPCQERALLRQILKKKGAGISVRRAVMELAGGNDKLALRFQNKFRSLLKVNKSLVNRVVAELKEEDNNFSASLGRERTNFGVSEVQVARLKKEINGLFERIFIDLKRENQRLSKENARLNAQNSEMYKLIYGTDMTNSVEMYFSHGGKKGLSS